jgi:glucose-1-phosphate cytidylyltransferase
MKAIILAGGLGTRLGSYTDKIPKPMVLIDGKPIIWHIMSTYSKYGIKDFIIALGYKGNVIKDYFLRYKENNTNIKINTSSGKVDFLSDMNEDWNISLIDTGIDTMTGGRVKRISNFIDDETFLLTYGDGLSNINIDKLLKFHKSHGKIATVTAVRPTARFGELLIQNDIVKSFKEKPQITEGWINGGFFVLNKKFFSLIEDDTSVLEAEPLEKAASIDELMAYKHDGFWQCMDTPRDKELLEKLSKGKEYPWLK